MKLRWLWFKRGVRVRVPLRLKRRIRVVRRVGGGTAVTFGTRLSWYHSMCLSDAGNLF